MAPQEQERSGGGHLLLFPFMAQGHLIPFLNLAKRIESLRRPGLAITIVSTPRNVASLRRAVPSGSSIGFAELAFSPTDHGLPPGAENTDVITLESFRAFYPATESLRRPFEELVSELARREGRENLCVVADILLGWTADSARELGVQHRVFLTCGAYASAIMFSLWLRPPPFARHADLDEQQPVVDFPGLRVRYVEFLNVVITEDFADDPMMAFLRRTLRLHFDHSGGLVINTSEEIEAEGLRLIRKLSALPTFAVGPLVGGRTPPGAAPDEDVVCIEFLDTKPPASVLYVSFGSQNTIPASQMMDLARGIEASGRPFIWAVRAPEEFDGKGHEFRDEWLPAGFEERAAAAARGVVVRRWAPQVRILAHASTGAFLSHCGWNSVLESLWHGVPLVCWPLLSDQLLDSRLLSELGVGVEVAAGRLHGGLRDTDGWGHVRDVVETVLGDGEKARDMRRRAAEVKEQARAAVRADGEVKGSSVLAMESLLDGAFR